VWAIEHESKIADVYRLNLGNHIIVEDILKINVKDWLDLLLILFVDILHFSPPCPSFSQAKANGKETENDIALARKIVEFIEVLQPRIVTLENVYGYRNSCSWRLIETALHNLGYQYDYWHVNFADYGVPQTRKRMVVIARRDGLRPSLPAATHAEWPEVGLFGTLKPWVGWYEAIEDLLPGLPESEFADWQLKRLPEEFKECLLVDSAGYPDSDGVRVAVQRSKKQPANVVVANYERRPMRAFIVDHQNISRDATVRRDDEPFFTVQAEQMRRPSSTPMAFLPHTQANSGTLDRYGDEPATTIAVEKIPDRAIIGGRVVRMTPECLARFQSFPKWYQLPEERKLACRGIGNAAPPLGMERITKHIVEGYYG
jgi:DNA (cytosine-5)-methyltransferase 1